MSLLDCSPETDFRYLESVITFAYVLLKMLERYSKNKQFMFVKKTTKRKKNKAQTDRDGVAPVPEEYENDSEDEGVPDDDAPSYAEHTFTFTKFEKKFASEGVSNTLLAYLQRYKELDNDKLRRVVGMIHRQVVKAQAEGLYFQVSSLALFRNIMDNKPFLPPGDAARDLIQLVTFISRKFFKRLQEDPFLMIEALMPKTRGRWKELSSWKGDGDDEMGGQRSRIREQVSCGLLDQLTADGPRQTRVHQEARPVDVAEDRCARQVLHRRGPRGLRQLDHHGKLDSAYLAKLTTDHGGYPRRAQRGHPFHGRGRRTRRRRRT